MTLISLITSSQEEEEEKKWFDNFSVNGSVDGYFRYTIGAQNDNSTAPATSFANQSGFALGMANIILGYEGEKAGFVVELVYGPRGTDATFNSGVFDAVGNRTGDATGNIINQLYAYWNVTEKVKLTFGNFNTFLGYEVISPTGNFNYSTSYMFSYGPFSHTGLKVDFAIDDNWSAMVAVMNPTDYTENNPFDTYIFGAQLGYFKDNGNAYLNFRYGNEGEPGEVGPTFQIDLTTGWDVSEKFYLGANATYLTIEDQGDGDAAGFYGIALYPQFKATEKFSLGVRGEYFAEFEDGVGALTTDTDGDGSVFAATLTGSYDVGNLTLKPELRLDSASEDTFPDNDNLTTEFNKSLSSFVMGAIYKF